MTGCTSILRMLIRSCARMGWGMDVMEMGVINRGMALEIQICLMTMTIRLSEHFFKISILNFHV